MLRLLGSVGGGELITMFILPTFFKQGGGGAGVQKLVRVGVGKHTKGCLVPHFPLIWHSRSHLPKKIDYLDKNCPSNRANQILDQPVKYLKIYYVQT